MSKVVAVNAGSSSLKMSLYDSSGDAGDPELLATAQVSRIGVDGTVEFCLTGSPPVHQPLTVPDHLRAAESLVELLSEARLLPEEGQLVIGHRVVHGGPRSTHCVIDESVLSDIEQAGAFAPLHNPPALSVIGAMYRIFGASTPMVATFDTAMFARLPSRAKQYAIPRELADRHAIRRYGFHGLAHTHMAERAAGLFGRDLGELKMVTLQLGNGCSAAAIKNGIAIDTSMGMTPLDGLVMGTRSGTVDPAIVALLADREGLSTTEVIALLNEKSGLLGVSGISSDMRDLAEAEANGHEGARLAREMFVYRIKKQIGAYAAALGGLDAVVFGGGIGEGAADLRERTCEGLGHLGVTIDQAQNQATSGEDADISDPARPVRALVVAVDEMAIIARESLRCVGAA